MTEKSHGYFKDNGTEFNPNLISKASLCATCKKNDSPEYEVACSLTRADQEEDIFICFAYEGISGRDVSTAVLKEMEQYLDRKYGKSG
jgi:hypothetical protein